LARRIEDRLAAVERISGTPGAAELAELKSALAARSGLLVAAAARLVGDLAVDSLVDALTPAFANLLERPVERDPGCRGKVQIARTLLQLERWSEPVFSRGAAHVQREPIWGGSIDTAAELRGLCGIAHARMARGDALEVLAQLLADPERATRAAAAQGLGDSGRPDAIPLLRYKAIIGDDEPAVLAACLGSLLALEPDPSVPFVAGLLAAGGERAEIAAIALGESRKEAALPALLAWCDAVAGASRAVGFLALALLRLEPATAHLIDVVQRGDPTEAVVAARALATFRDDPALVSRVTSASAQRDATTRGEIQSLFAR
jgi:hypothetical protein